MKKKNRIFDLVIFTIFSLKKYGRISNFVQTIVYGS